ncbi:cilia- and flagella-associated protein 43 [Fopius arisanus]|uniref:Cilia- and flagella-associated protein 43 n=1 Tax=Fopius arisanus TaxID=64838 RepID=A0A9R1TXE8_9HYME|nr:PREDICTED: cilia- and flagella-associated protein 43-like [Fopius arisanus]
MPNAETKWVKFGEIKTIAFLGKDTVAIASGLHVIFINLNTKEERVEKFDSKERGEGARCLAGHPVVPMFAISERRANPKVRVYTYPSINKVSDCVYREKNWTGYISSAFAGTDYLLTLTSSPSFKMIVWLWRTGECVATVKTGITDEYQTLYSSPTSPTLIAQLGVPSGLMNVYELNICSKIVSLVLSSQDSKPERITSASWTYDGSLLLSDDVGNVYLTPTDGKRRHQVLQRLETAPQPPGPLLVAFRGGVSVANTSPNLFDDYQRFVLADAQLSSHRLRDVKINTDSRYVITFGYDGLVAIRNRASLSELLCLFTTHHRQEGGIKLAVVSLSTSMLITLGKNGNLVASKISQLESVEIGDHVPNVEVVLSSSTRTEWDEDLTWMEVKEAKKLDRERDEFAIERASILSDFGNLRDKLKALIDDNEKASEVAKLPLETFDLDKEGRARLIERNHEGQGNLVRTLEEKASREAEIKALNLLKGNDDDEEEKFVLSGTTTHRWIREDPSRVVNQILRDGSYCEGVKRNILGKIREEKLKIYFNKLFETMRSRKSTEIELAKNRIARIQYCTSELKQMFQVDCTIDHSWLKLEWQESERPESVVEVEDEEVYRVINDSGAEANVKRLDNSVTRESSVFTDSFRRRELKKMMDGVLEVKWEDEIKKDIARPDCLTRDPSTYSEDDLRIIENYESALKDLGREREKYRRYLEREVQVLEESLKSSIVNFNEEMKQLHLKRLKIESAVLQETLMRLRECQRHQLRLKGMEAVASLEINELAPAVDHTKNLTENFSALESAVNETRVRYDNLSKREKLLEGKFRGEFTDLKQPMVEHLLRQYKKRPRLGQMTCTSVTYLGEMGKCILSGEKSEILPRECLDFLKGMDMLDVMPSGLPSQIDGSHWMILCKLRRFKVEIEIRLKSCAVELAEAEQTLSSHQKTIQNSQSRVQQLRETITERKRLNAEAMRDMEVQLVLTMGQIETQLSGDPRDLDNAVLVPFDVVLGVNDAIVAAGRKKLGAMKRTMEFRRTIEWQEWRHACMRMTLEDLKEDLKTLQGVKVTREIQMYLMRHDSMGGIDKDGHISEKILSSTQERLSRILTAEKSRLFDIIKTVNLWQKRNDRLEDKIEKAKAENCKMSVLANDEARLRQERFVRAKVKAIMKRNRLVKRIQDNYAELMSLRTHLELLRLKTYPTLRLKDATRFKKNSFH